MKLMERLRYHEKDRGEISIDPLKETNETLSTLEVDMKKVKVQYLQILDDAKRYEEKRGGMVDKWNKLQCIRYGR